jgi:hypothetical protein
MPRFAFRLARSRRRAASLAAAALGCVCAAVASMVACLTAPPGDLPTLPLHRPTILHDAVQPPTDQVLGTLPADGVFVVPVVLEDPNEFFEWAVFINYVDHNSPARYLQPETPTPGTIDGGVFPVSFQLFETDFSDPMACNRIDFLVAHQFNQSSPHTPDSTGGDIVTWLYSSGGAAACVETYDAGDGAFPSGDAGGDGSIVVPQDGGDP